MKALVAALATVPLLTGAFACTSDGSPGGLENIARCPGESCTQDVRDRIEELEQLPRVMSVQHLERSSRFDRGASRTAAVSARVADRAEAREVALAALAVLEDWPEHDRGPATVAVHADPEVTVSYVAREDLEMPLGQFAACSVAECAGAADEVRERVGEDYPDVETLRFEVAGDTLRVTARAERDQVALVASAVRRHLIGVGARIADRAAIQVTGEGPLALTLRLDDGLVCEQPPGTRNSCDPDNSRPFGSY